MRLIYICHHCQQYIGEVDVVEWDESRLGFDILDDTERQELIHLDWDRQVGTVEAICDECMAKDDVLENRSGAFYIH